MTKAIRQYFAALDVGSIAHGYDDYHWSGGAEGKGVFKFNKNKDFHAMTKRRCKQAIAESITAGIPVVIIDNANFEKWQYGQSIQLAMKHEYAVSIIEINSQTPEHPRNYHLMHLRDQFEDNECFLCLFANRCKMRVPPSVIEKFIMKYQEDPNVIIVSPKLNEHEMWTNGELKALLGIQRNIDPNDYDDAEWTKTQNITHQRPLKNDRDRRSRKKRGGRHQYDSYGDSSRKRGSGYRYRSSRHRDWSENRSTNGSNRKERNHRRNPNERNEIRDRRYGDHSRDVDYSHYHANEWDDEKDLSKTSYDSHHRIRSRWNNAEFIGTYEGSWRKKDDQNDFQRHRGWNEDGYEHAYGYEDTRSNHRSSGTGRNRYDNRNKGRNRGKGGRKYNPGGREDAY